VVEDELVQMVVWIYEGSKVWELSWMGLIDSLLEEGPGQERFLEVGSFCARDRAPDHEAPMEGNVRVKVTLNDYLCRLAPPVALHNKPFKSV
jgi:hypothetical protein